MVQPNWGLLQGGGGFQNALAQGFQFGQLNRQRQEEKEYKNALAQFDPSNPETLKPIMQARPEVGIQLQEQVAKRQEAAQTEDITRRAISGDPQAMDELAVKNLPAWRALSAEQRDAATQETKIFGNAALDILNRPPEQRMAAVQAYVQQLGRQYPEVAQIAQMPAEQLESVLRAAVAEAQMVDKLHSMERPDYMAIPAGGTLVDTRNPQAVQQFGQQGGPQPGMVEDGFVFKGGNPADPNAWEPVSAGGAGSGQQGFQR